MNAVPLSIASAPKLNNNGLARLASNWTRFPSWKQNLSNDTINTDLNNGNDLLGVFQDVLGGYGVKVKAAGYYKATCQMHFYSTTANTSVAIRFAKNALVDDRCPRPRSRKSRTLSNVSLSDRKHGIIGVLESSNTLRRR